MLSSNSNRLVGVEDYTATPKRRRTDQPQQQHQADRDRVQVEHAKLLEKIAVAEAAQHAAETARDDAKAAQHAAEAAQKVAEEALVAHRQQPSGSTARPTKSGLFAHISRYLGATMTALLRMELFGDQDREYQQDERRVCREILDQPVAAEGAFYEHMRSEWRVRLPHREVVQNWPAESDEDTEGE